MSTGFLSYKYSIKPVLDFTVSLFAFIILLPVFFLISAVLYFANDGKPFFFQLRPGKQGKIFKLVKFRTMNEKKNKQGELLPDADRLTGLGKFIRRTSLDEIPQLLNIIRGDMSLIGPRPLLVEYLALYNEFQKRRHEVKPGITGWAQVNGRNTISWQQKFEFDLWYVDNISFGLDMKILFKTFRKVIKSEGINAADATTMETFNGN